MARDRVLALILDFRRRDLIRTDDATGVRLGSRPAGDPRTEDELSLGGEDASIGTGVALRRGALLEPGTTA